MKNLGIVFFVIGVLGFVWTLYGSMMISLIFGGLKKILSGVKSAETNNKKISFEILIAAYNEEATIIPTLQSFEKCAQRLKEINSNVSVNAFVGLDHCTDKTLPLVQEFKARSSMEIKYFENNGERGKWFILKQLIARSNADWVSLTDCGTVWDTELLVKVERFLKQDDLICIAPSYLPMNAKLLETIYWRMEQFIRTIENLGGGSIMVHGITVFYKREALLRAIELLGTTHWFNDDVVIPLTLRLDNPKNSIKYFADFKTVAWVRDIGIVSNVGVEYKRRKRILIGNLQIIKKLILPRFNFFSLASWTSLRLVFKALWAFWATFFGLGLVITVLSSDTVRGLLSPQTPVKMGGEIAAVLIALFMIKKSNYIHRLFMAYLSGMEIHKGWKALENPDKISWS